MSEVRDHDHDHELSSSSQAIHSIAWHHEGKQFICSHSDGTLTTWNIRTPAKPVHTVTPHGRRGAALARCGCADG